MNQLWQIDFIYFKIQGWGWYYLSTVLDDHFRYGLAWKLAATMAATEVRETLEKALAQAKLDRVRSGMSRGCFRTSGHAMCLRSPAGGLPLGAYSLKGRPRLMEVVDSHIFTT